MVYSLQAPGRYLRSRSTASTLVPVETFISNPAKLRRWSYSIDPNVDPLAARKPLDFTAEQKEEDGSVFMKAHGVLTFSGAEKVQVAGCTFDVVKAMQQFVTKFETTVRVYRASFDSDYYLNREVMLSTPPPGMHSFFIAHSNLPW